MSSRAEPAPPQADADAHAAQITQSFCEAIALLHRGKHASARALADALLAHRPDDAGALCLAADIEFRGGNTKRAHQLINRSIAIDRDIPRAHHVLANIRQDEGKLDRAISSYRKALRLNPYFAEAQNDLGHAYFSKGWPQEAIGCFERAIRAAPDHEVAYENLGQVHRRQNNPAAAKRCLQRALRLKLGNSIRSLLRIGPPGPGLAAYLSGSPSARCQSQLELLDLTRQALITKNHAPAEAACRKALAERPRDVDALRMLGFILGQMGRHDEGIDALRAALAIDESAEVQVALGKLYCGRRRFDEAIASYQTALRLDAKLAEAHSDLSMVYFEIGMAQEAERSARAALSIDNTIAEAHSNLAAALWTGNSLAEAEQHCREAIRLKPELPAPYSNLGLVLKEQGRNAEALRAFEQGLSHNVGDAGLLRNCGFLLQSSFGRLDEALASFRKAQMLDPGNERTHVFEALLLLLRGEFAEGWKKYEWRKQNPHHANFYRYLSLPEWGGESVPGKTLLVQSEQGLGDEIMFASCLEEARTRAGRCVLLCSPRLAQLFERSFPQVKVMPADTCAQIDAVIAAERPHLKVAAGTLPVLLRADASSFPRHQGYLRADTDRVASMRQRLEALGPGPRIGLSWRGGVPATGRQGRSIDLDQLVPLLRLPGCKWVSLQYGDCGTEIGRVRAAHGVALTHWQDPIDNLDDMAALVSALDLTLSVCNTTVHLAGALGRAVWVMAPFVPEWRYGLSGEGMIWYPSVRMFRQREFADWPGVIEQVRVALDQRIAGGA